MKKTFIFCSLFLVLTLVFGLAINLASAQEDENNANESIMIANANEEVTPEELDAPDPKILPNSPWYWAKSLWRGLRLVATLDPVKKAEYRLQIANERLIELQKMAQAGDITKERMEVILKKYDKEIEKLEIKMETVQAKYQARAEQLMEKYGDQELARQRLMKKLEEKVSTRTIIEIREKSLERFGGILENINEGKTEEWLNKILENKPALKNLHNLEVLSEVAEKVSAQAKTAIEQAQQNAMKRIEAKLGELSVEEKEAIIEKYLANDPEALRGIIMEKIEDLSDDSVLRNQIRNIRTQAQFEQEQEQEREQEQIQAQNQNQVQIQDEVQEQNQQMNQNRKNQ